MDRITKNSNRERIQNQMKNLKKHYRAALKDNELQEAFDQVWKDWNSEMGAMIYAQIVSPLDLIDLTGVISNRKQIQDLQAKIEKLEENIDKKLQD